MGIELHMPPDWQILDDNGNEVAITKLTDRQLAELVFSFADLLIALRERERMH